MHRYDFVRYGIWGGIVATAVANQREYHMSTTWLPHLAGNSVSLLLPDVYRLLDQALPASGDLPADLATVRVTLDRLVRDNPKYLAYVVPLAVGYLTSHPQFNIYKGRMGELRFAGFGLDAIPHSSTAFALTTLVCDTLREAAQHAPQHTWAARAIRWGSQHQALCSGALLALVTAVWESGEYRIYKHERGLRGSDDKINMQWSAQDTLFDCLANALGWAAATAWRNRASL